MVGSRGRPTAIHKKIAPGTVGNRSIQFIPTPPFLSYGRLIGEQLEWLGTMKPKSDQEFQVVLLHHNLHQLKSPFKNWSKRLKNAESALQLLFEKRVNLVLHGHTHVHQRTKLTTKDHSLFLLGCGSSTWNHPQYKGRYSIYSIDGGELVDIESRVFRPDTGEFQTDLVELEMMENPAWVVESGPSVGALRRNTKALFLTGRRLLRFAA